VGSPRMKSGLAHTLAVDPRRDREECTMAEARRGRSLFRHPLAALGGSLFLAGGFLFVLLLLYDLTATHDNPYRSLITFLGAPFVVTLGAVLFVVSTWLQVRAARRRGEDVRFRLSIDPSDPAYLRNLWLFLGLSAVLLVLVTYSGTRAYEATDSVAFCGETCHTVMHPEMTTYQHSPHARVPCVDCHIGPGASFWVKSKINGLRQVWAMMMHSYPKPIPTPIVDLRPAQATCEGCHWPKVFYGAKLVTRTYYRSDEHNSPWSIRLALNIGGGNPQTGALEGIHWHMITANKVEYVAVDEKRQKIPWVRVTDERGNVTVYTNPEIEGVTDLGNGSGAPPAGHAVRTFDCLDCHNRPSHRFQPPATSLNLALSTRRISPALPFVRKVGLELLTTVYPDARTARERIRSGLGAYYAEKFPNVARSQPDEIEQASDALLAIYAENFFPAMDTDYRARIDNLSHFVNDGCFRCHTPSMTNRRGEALFSSCHTCHTIVAQGPGESVETLESNLDGLPFQHPEEIGGLWREMKCTACHTPDSGY
jgi:hypothetical protein